MRTASALVLVQLLAVVSACSGRDGVPLDWPEAHYSPATWREAKPEARYSLVRDLIESRRLNGLEHDQAVHISTSGYRFPV
jgi:hypothetical protein